MIVSYKKNIQKCVSVAAMLFLLPFLISCDDSSGPSASENYISGAVNLAELIGVIHTDIWVYLVEFTGTGQEIADSVQPDFSGEYEFLNFDLGTYAVEAETYQGFSPHYYGFRDNDNNDYFDIGDALNFSSFAHLTDYNIPLYRYGFLPDTTESEFESNDDPYFAQDLGTIHLLHISGDVASGGFIEPDEYTGDKDFYRFRAVWTGDLYIELRWSGAADLDLLLYNGYSYEFIDRSPYSYPSPNYIDRRIYRDEEYIVLVASADFAAFYELSINIR